MPRNDDFNPAQFKEQMEKQSDTSLISSVMIATIAHHKGKALLDHLGSQDLSGVQITRFQELASLYLNNKQRLEIVVGILNKRGIEIALIEEDD